MTLALGIVIKGTFQSGKLVASGAVDLTLTRNFHESTGSGAFIGLGAYSFWSGRKQIQANQAAIARSGSRFSASTRQGAVMAISGALVWMGIYRLMK